MLKGTEQLYVSQGGDGTPISLDTLVAYLQANMAGLMTPAAVAAIAALVPATATAEEIVDALQAE